MRGHRVSIETVPSFEWWPDSLWWVWIGRWNRKMVWCQALGDATLVPLVRAGTEQTSTLQEEALTQGYLEREATYKNIEGLGEHGWAKWHTSFDQEGSESHFALQDNPILAMHCNHPFVCWKKERRIFPSTADQPLESCIFQVKQKRSFGNISGRERSIQAKSEPSNEYSAKAHDIDALTVNIC